MSWIRKLKRFTKTRTRCLVVVYEEINAVFWKEKDPKMTKKTENFQILNVSMQFLSNFRKNSWTRMLKTINMVQVCCPVGGSEEIMAVFYLKKSQIDTETDKSP